MSELINAAEKAASVATDVASVPSAIERYLFMGLAYVASLGVAFGVGYAYRWHGDEVNAAASKATVATAAVAASAVVAIADTKTDATLANQLAAAKARAASLQSQIEAAQHANPAPVDCRVPGSLLDNLNADLAGPTGASEVSGAVQP